MVEQTNLYAVQLNSEKPLKLPMMKMSSLLALASLCPFMSYQDSACFGSYPRGVDCVAKTMTMHHWEAIKHNLHFAENMQQIPPGQPGHDSLYKVCPLLTSLLQCFQAIPKDERLCVDEQVVFEVYTGSISPMDGMPDIGTSGSIV